jgi:hypothetical protein
MSDEMIRHLEFIQGVINRMARNSFAIKGWAITLIAAIFVLGIGQSIAWYFFLIALLPALVFWGLDGYYLRQELLFRKLYDEVREATEEE